MTLEEFKSKVGPRHAVIMECPKDMQVAGKFYAKGAKKNVLINYAYKLYTRWGWHLKVGFLIDNKEADTLNKHFEKEHEIETTGKKKIT